MELIFKKQEPNNLKEENVQQYYLQQILKNQKIYIYKDKRYPVGIIFEKICIELGASIVEEITNQTTICLTRSQLDPKYYEICLLYSIPILQNLWIIDCRIHMTKLQFENYKFIPFNELKIKKQTRGQQQQLLNIIQLIPKQNVQTAISKQLQNYTIKIIKYIYISKTINNNIKDYIPILISNKNQQINNYAYQIILQIEDCDYLIIDQINYFNIDLLYAIIRGINLITIEEIYKKSYIKDQQFNCINFHCLRTKLFLNQTFTLENISYLQRSLWKYILETLGAIIDTNGKQITNYKRNMEEQSITFIKIKGEIIKKCKIFKMEEVD